MDDECGLDDEVFEGRVVEEGGVSVVLLEVCVDALHNELHLVDSDALVQLVVPQQFPYVGRLHESAAFREVVEGADVIGA